MMTTSVPQYTHHREGYGKNAAEQKGIAASVLPAIIEALGGTNVLNDKTVTVCDYGAADGMISIPLIKACRDHLDGKCGQCDLLWIFNDLPNNNYNRLFKNAQEVVGRHFEEADNIFLAATAGSFYQQVMPKESVDFGLCLTAVHWLSDSIYTCEHDGTQQQLTKEMGKKDWMIFLLSRAREMKPGSQLVVTVAGDGQDAEGVHFTMGAYLAIKNLCDKKYITQEEFQVMTATLIVFRNEEDVREPFEAGANPEATRAGLRLVRVDRYTQEISLLAEWQKSGGMNNQAATETAVKKMVDYFKTFSDTFLAILSTTREEQEERDMFQAFYQEAEHVIRKNLEIFQPYYRNLIVQIEKRI